MRFPSPLLGLAAILILPVTLWSYRTGVQSGTNSVPANASRQLPACSLCHLGAAPAPGRLNPPQATLTVSKRALQLNEQITVSAQATGGPNATTGGFLCEATAGTFTTGTNTRIVTNPASITHASNSSRSWTWSFTAPAAPGLVELTLAVNATNGDGFNSGDQFAFAGGDGNATVATPVRLYVLPQGVFSVGSACPDGFGNFPVLGATSTPAAGNAAFGLQVVGATPSSLAFLLAGFNPPGFTNLDLGALFGITGCLGYVANPLATGAAPTSAGVVERAEGTATFPLPLPAQPSLVGLAVDFQAAHLDPSAVTRLGRAHPVTFANGLRVVVQ